MTLLGQLVTFLCSQSTAVFGTVHPGLGAVHRNLTWLQCFDLAKILQDLL